MTKKQETHRIEYKRELNDKLEREVVAFLNYHQDGVITNYASFQSSAQ